MIQKQKRLILYFLPILSLLWYTKASVPADEDRDEAHDCLAQTLYWEARSGKRESMIAVGSVVFNRMQSRDFPETVCAVVREGGETSPCQFSYWCDGHTDVPPKDKETWQLAQEVATEMLDNRPQDPTGSALFYHADDIDVPWATQRTRTTAIGGHIFYR